MKICVLLSAADLGERYTRPAREFAELIGAGGHTLVGCLRPPVRARRRCDVSALLLDRRCRGVGQSSGLVLYFRSDLLQFGRELAPVMRAEEQFAATDEDDAQVCLGAAAVAAIGGRQWARGGQNSSHVASSLARRAVVPGSTSNQAENVPADGFSSKTGLGVTGCYRLAANRSHLRQMSLVVLLLLLSTLVPAGLPEVLVRTCPEPKWFMPLWERDMCITRAGYRTSAR